MSCTGCKCLCKLPVQNIANFIELAFYQFEQSIWWLAKNAKISQPAVVVGLRHGAYNFAGWYTAAYCFCQCMQLGTAIGSSPMCRQCRLSIGRHSLLMPGAVHRCVPSVQNLPALSNGLRYFRLMQKVFRPAKKRENLEKSFG